MRHDKRTRDQGSDTALAHDLRYVVSKHGKRHYHKSFLYSTVADIPTLLKNIGYNESHRNANSHRQNAQLDKTSNNGKSCFSCHGLIVIFLVFFDSLVENYHHHIIKKTLTQNYGENVGLLIEVQN